MAQGTLDDSFRRRKHQAIDTDADSDEDSPPKKRRVMIKPYERRQSSSMPAAAKKNASPLSQRLPPSLMTVHKPHKLNKSRAAAAASTSHAPSTPHLPTPIASTRKSSRTRPLPSPLSIDIQVVPSSLTQDTLSSQSLTSSPTSISAAFSSAPLDLRSYPGSSFPATRDVDIESSQSQYLIHHDASPRRRRKRHSNHSDEIGEVVPTSQSDIEGELAIPREAQSTGQEHSQSEKKSSSDEEPALPSPLPFDSCRSFPTSQEKNDSQEMEKLPDDNDHTFRNTLPEDISSQWFHASVPSAIAEFRDMFGRSQSLPESFPPL